MRKLFSTRRRIAIVASAAIVALSAVAAFAYFTSTGTGSGSAKVGASTTFEVASTAYTGGPLTPGGGSGTYESLTYTVHNPSTGYQNLANVAISVANSDGTAWKTPDPNGTGNPQCTAADFELSIDGGSTWAAGTSNDTRAAGDLAPSATTAAKTVMIRMVDNGLNQDNCQNAVVPLYFSAT